MSTIDEIMDQVGKYAIAWTDACTCEMCDEHSTHVHQLDVKSALREMITAALTDARREGAEAMREAAADACEHISDKYHKKEHHKYPEMKTDAETGASDCEYAIRALPLPTGPRQAVLLTDDCVREIAYKSGCFDPEFDITGAQTDGLSRAIEAAVLAANGLTK